MLSARFVAAALACAPLAAAISQTPLAHDTIRVGRVTREYLYSLPPSVDSVRGAPLVLFLHGGGGSARGAAERIGFTEVAGAAGAIVVYPDGVNRHWSDGRDYFHDADDVAFIQALIAKLRRSMHIDPRRIYIAGHSNGAIMAYTLVCRLPGVFAAIGTVGGELATNDAARCGDAHPISVIAIHGTADPLVPYDGGGLRGAVLGAEQSARFWSKVDSCAPDPRKTTFPPHTPADSTHAIRLEYDHCAGGRSVVLYAIDGGGHAWPGATEALPESIVGPRTNAVDATVVIWGFFTTHPPP